MIPRETHFTNGSNTCNWVDIVQNNKETPLWVRPNGVDPSKRIVSIDQTLNHVVSWGITF